MWMLVPQVDAYNAEFQQQVLGGGMTHLWAGGTKRSVGSEEMDACHNSKEMVLQSDSVMAIFQAGRSRDIQTCAREISPACAVHDVTLSFSHTSREQLVDTAHALIHFHKGGGVSRQGPWAHGTRS